MLVDELQTLQADLVVFGFKAWGYHWNVESIDFPQYHGFFGEIYDDVIDSIDPVAENIRKVGQYAPFKLASFQKLTGQKDTTVKPDPKAMATDLREANADLLNQLDATFKVATAENQQGIANFIAERIDQHEKWAWQLSASTK
jgi:starvation-inducible DNA-binding protein